MRVDRDIPISPVFCPLCGENGQTAGHPACPYGSAEKKEEA